MIKNSDPVSIIESSINLWGDGGILICGKTRVGKTKLLKELVKRDTYFRKIIIDDHRELLKELSLESKNNIAYFKKTSLDEHEQFRTSLLRFLRQGDPVYIDELITFEDFELYFRLESTGHTCITTLQNNTFGESVEFIKKFFEQLCLNHHEWESAGRHFKHIVEMKPTDQPYSIEKIMKFNKEKRRYETIYQSS